MVVAGGGGGGGCGSDGIGGGGGAGGYRETKSPVTPYVASPLDGYSTPGNRITVTATGFPIQLVDLVVLNVILDQFQLFQVLHLLVVVKEV